MMLLLMYRFLGYSLPCDPTFLCPLFLPFSWPLPQLEPSQIRLIVYQDCERRGRNVLFDSAAKKRATEETPITVSRMSFLLLLLLFSFPPSSLCACELLTFGTFPNC